MMTFVMLYGSTWPMIMGALTPNVGYSESKTEDNRGGEGLNEAIKYLFYIQRE